MTTPNENDLTNICRIAQGLLASGHFTCPIDENGESNPEIKRFDGGKERKPRRGYHVTGEAINLYKDIAFEWAIRREG
jgi:hypothetical protein